MYPPVQMDRNAVLGLVRAGGGVDGMSDAGGGVRETDHAGVPRC
jgi:hypothetical protein